VNCEVNLSPLVLFNFLNYFEVLCLLNILLGIRPLSRCTRADKMSVALYANIYIYDGEI